MDQPAVECTTWIAAPREQLWQAMTDPDHVAKWLLPPAMGAQMTRDDSGMLSVSMPYMQIPLAIVEATEPPHQTTIRSYPDALITTTYRLDEENDGTRVTVTMAGFDAFPEDARQDRLAPSRMGWERALENLKAYIAGADLPYPEGYVAALFGYRREGKETLSVERSIWIAAPQQKVWDAITDPVQIEKWFSPGTPWHRSAPEVGGRLFVRNPEDGSEMYTEVITLLDPPRHYVTYTEANPSNVTAYTLREENGGTRLTITHSGYAKASAEAHASAEQNAFGFGMMLGNIKALLEEIALPQPGGF